MDTLAHSLWSILFGRAGRSRVRWWVLALVGAGPDLVWLPFTAYDLIMGHGLAFHWGPYNVSHSLVLWAIVTLVLTFVWRKTAWQWTWPWALHIVLDIFGHIDMPTPILWPVSSFHIVGGFNWLTPRVWVGTYAVLGFSWLVLFLVRRRKKIIGAVNKK